MTTSTTTSATPSAQTTRTDNAELVRRLFDAYGANDAAQLDALLAPDFVAHGLPPEFGDGPAVMTASAAVMHAALADCRCEIDDLLADDDRVAVRYTTRARHVGELFGAAPSGRSVTLTGMEIYRLVDGRVAEYWGAGDMSELQAASAPEGA